MSLTTLEERSNIKWKEMVVSGWRVKLPADQEFWGFRRKKELRQCIRCEEKKTLLWEIRRTIVGPVVCTCLHCRENYCRQFWLYPDCHHSQPPVLFAGIPHSAWCTPASLRKFRMKSSDLCPLERKEHVTWPGPSDAQEPSRRAGRIIQLAGIPQWQQHPVVFSIGSVHWKCCHQGPGQTVPIWLWFQPVRHWIRPDFSAWFFMMNF